MPTIQQAALEFLRQPLASPFGFKGGTLRELWHPVCRLQAGSLSGLGVAVQSVLWANPAVFAAHSPAGSNALMLAVTDHAIGLLREMDLKPPPVMLEELFTPAMAFAKKVVGPHVTPTFVLNALESVDLALWQLWAAHTGADGFDSLAAPFTKALTARQDILGNIPLISYEKTGQDILRLVREGAFLLKIKIGAPGAAEEMLEKDKARLQEIHALVGGIPTPHTNYGYPAYYLDANGRYETVGQVQALLDHAQTIGALERIVILEEPFPVGSGLSVKELPVQVAADESAHHAADIGPLAELGYTAVALKPVAKTLSGSLAVLNAAQSCGMACFCADLTVPPVMLDWNMQVAARLPCLPGLKAGVVESNGAQNYPDWEALLAMAPGRSQEYLVPQDGMYTLDDGFYTASGFLRPPPAYGRLFF